MHFESHKLTFLTVSIPWVVTFMLYATLCKMFTVFHAAWLGILQGLSEFLPVSSSAHLILLPRYFHWPDPGLAFDVALHLGTLLAVVVYFWRDLERYFKAFIDFRAPNLAPERRLV